MLSVEVCERCMAQPPPYDEFWLGLEQPWPYNLWRQTGPIRCPRRHPAQGIREDREPPVFCPYRVEHLVHVKR